MYDHIGLKVKDLDASVRFYEAVLKPLSFVLGSHDKTYAGLGPKDTPALWLYAGGMAPARMSRSQRLTAPRSQLSTPLGSNTAATTTASQARALITARPTTRRS